MRRLSENTNLGWVLRQNLNPGQNENNLSSLEKPYVWLGLFTQSNHNVLCYFCAELHTTFRPEMHVGR